MHAGATNPPSMTLQFFAPTPVDSDQPFTFVAQLSNLTSTDIQQVTLDIDLPPEIRLEPGGLPPNSPPESWYCFENTTGPEITCAIPSVPANGNQALPFKVRAGLNAGTETITVQISGDAQIVSTPETSHGSIDIDIRRIRTDLSVIKFVQQDSVAPLIAGEPFEYWIYVFTNGPNPAENVEVTDTLAPSLTLGTPSTDQGSCSLGGTLENELTCTIGTLVGPDVPYVIIRIPATTTSDADLTNTASATTTTYQDSADLANDSWTVDTEVDQGASSVIPADGGTLIDGQIGPGGEPVATGSDPTASSMTVPAGPGGTSSIYEEQCADPFMCPAPAALRASTIPAAPVKPAPTVFGGLLHFVVPDGYQNPITATIVYDVSIVPASARKFIVLRETESGSTAALAACTKRAPTYPCVKSITKLKSPNAGDLRVVILFLNSTRVGTAA
jgi:uncharacterized repeat protein (TIGR01451 family)